MAAEKKGSMLGTIVPIVVLTALAGGGGALVGRQIMTTARLQAAKEPAAQEAPKPAPVAPGETRVLKELQPVVTNLSAPDGVWVRLQAAIVYDKADAQGMDVTATRVNEDILAFVRSLTLAELQGSSGLDALRDELNERAHVRSDGKIRELLIETLVVR